ncbi:MAG: DsbE family thiol:disulfide interchange protein [Paracoccaceae bacterium]|nr:DsbE family thiol:disulfide interchange protein [Paracoccaceae bacterium]MDE3123118.1 DsbE family thiol:disulfide interchange protein [Paracoccaceae bacterium]MDE3237419.1 DsbE family thiol:disulfide interchange protein [Paracoccaceae bacterium]
MILPPAVFIAVAVAFWAGMNQKNPDQLPSMMVGKEAPPVTLTQLGDTAPFTNAALRDGHVKLVNFWASWCVPCRVEAPMLGKMAAAGVKILGVNYKDKPADALKFLADAGDPFAAMGADPAGQMGIEWGIYGVPETFVIDGKGKVLLRFPGPITADVLASTIEPALKKAAAD